MSNIALFVVASVVVIGTHVLLRAFLVKKHHFTTNAALPAVEETFAEPSNTPAVVTMLSRKEQVHSVALQAVAASPEQLEELEQEYSHDQALLNAMSLARFAVSWQAEYTAPDLNKEVNDAILKAIHHISHGSPVDSPLTEEAPAIVELSEREHGQLQHDLVLLQTAEKLCGHDMSDIAKAIFFAKRRQLKTTLDNARIVPAFDVNTVTSPDGYASDRTVTPRRTNPADRGRSAYNTASSTSYDSRSPTPTPTQRTLTREEQLAEAKSFMAGATRGGNKSKGRASQRSVWYQTHTPNTSLSTRFHARPGGSIRRLPNGMRTTSQVAPPKPRPALPEGFVPPHMRALAKAKALKAGAAASKAVTEAVDAAPQPPTSQSQVLTSTIPQTIVEVVDATPRSLTPEPRSPSSATPQVVAEVAQVVDATLQSPALESKGSGSTTPHAVAEAVEATPQSSALESQRSGSTTPQALDEKSPASQSQSPSTPALQASGFSVTPSSSPLRMVPRATPSAVLKSYGYLPTDGPLDSLSNSMWAQNGQHAAWCARCGRGIRELIVRAAESGRSLCVPCHSVDDRIDDAKKLISGSKPIGSSKQKEADPPIKTSGPRPLYWSKLKISHDRPEQAASFAQNEDLTENEDLVENEDLIDFGEDGSSLNADAPSFTPVVKLPTKKPAAALQDPGPTIRLQPQQENHAPETSICATVPPPGLGPNPHSQGVTQAMFDALLKPEVQPQVSAPPGLFPIPLYAAVTQALCDPPLQPEVQSKESAEPLSEEDDSETPEDWVLITLRDRAIMARDHRLGTIRFFQEQKGLERVGLQKLSIVTQSYMQKRQELQDYLCEDWNDDWEACLPAV